MLTAIILLSVALLLVLVLAALYRCEMKRMGDQIDFLLNNDSNLEIGTVLPFSELVQMASRINGVLADPRKAKRQAIRNENELKEAIANLSHDIRTPLTSLDGYFQMLPECKTEEERKKYLTIIQGRIQCLKDMLESLFTYTKLQDRNYTMELKTTDFGKCVYDTVFSFYDSFQEKGIEPTAAFCDERIFVQADETALRRVLQNIIKNTLEHGEDSVRLELKVEDRRAHFICANWLSAPEQVNVSRLFTRFYKADASRSSTSTGLGLPIAKDLTQRMNGDMDVRIEDHMFVVDVSFPCV